MPAILHDLSANWLLYASMPLIAAVIGYATKVVAVEMMFRPIDFVGKPPLLGWQGVIPRNAGRMASVAMNLLLDRLIDPKEILGRLDADRIVAEIRGPLDAAVAEIGAEILSTHQPSLWELLPVPARRLLLRQVQAQAPKVVTEVLAEFAADIERFIDVRDMAVTNLVRDRAVLNTLIRDISRPEMRFIVRCGLYFGLVLGVLQAAVWALTHEPWVMPIFGALIGLGTDWVALKMIFYPREERRLLGVLRWQGMFHKRRRQVAADYGRLIAEQVLTMPKILDALLTGPRSDRLVMMVQRHVAKIVDENVGVARPLVLLTIGSAGYERLRADIAARAAAELTTTIRPAIGYAQDALDVERTIVDAMLQLSPIEYEGVLRPAFRQDEWKLIVVGGILGALVGELQVLLLLG